MQTIETAVNLTSNFKDYC